MTSTNSRIVLRLACAFALFGLSCDSEGGGVRTEDVGDGVLVITDEGSLTLARPSDDNGRRNALIGYLRTHHDLFGPDEVEPDALSFIRAVTQEQVGNEAGETYTLVVLHQTYMGVPVIDEFQMGAFLQTADGDELRRVRAGVRDPSALPMPPDPSTRDQVVPVVARLIRELGLSADLTQISETPVISAKQDISGFRVSQFRPSERGGFDLFEAIVDPLDGRVVVLSDQPPCELTPLPPGTVVEEGAPISFEPPSLLGIRFIPIHAVKLSDLNGSNVAPITRPQVRRWVDFANTAWFPEAQILFEFDDSAGSADFESWRSTLFNTLPANEAEHFTYRTAANVWALLFHHRKAVVFFRANSGYGFSWGPTSTFFVSMPSYTDTGIFKPDDGGWVPNDTLLSHELGHYFGLAHPFTGVACNDAIQANSDGDAAGQDPGTTADDVLDTNPDLTDACAPTNSLTCAGGSFPYNDEVWNPPWANVMSYHDCLPEDLTDDQVGVIDLTLQHPVRAELGR